MDDKRTILIISGAGIILGIIILISIIIFNSKSSGKDLIIINFEEHRSFSNGSPELVAGGYLKNNSNAIYENITVTAQTTDSDGGVIYDCCSIDRLVPGQAKNLIFYFRDSGKTRVRIKEINGTKLSQN